ncbi:MAG TPA: VanZ family protein [Bacillota bacterium]|nr:VanZ family protein [Bacillota bacterium]
MRLKTRVMGIIVLTFVLAGVIGFLLHTSKNVQWGGGFWENWLRVRFNMQPVTAHLVVFWLRKSVHFMGYGGLTLLFGLYFYLWGLRKTAYWGLLGTAAIASFDEYNQSLSSFRSGQPTDVFLDVCGGIFFTWVVYGWLRYRKRRMNQ